MKLTKNEQIIVDCMFENNSSGATSYEELLNDNMACITVSELREKLDWTPRKIGGVISSLQVKDLITIEERDGPLFKGRATKRNEMQRMMFMPDIYWLSNDFIKSQIS